MGTYLNPGNAAFADIRNDIYIDKSGLIELINESINTPIRLSCVSRPRRLGKSFAAQMLCAIAKKTSFRKHLNQYDVIYIDMSGTAPYTDNYQMLIPFLSNNITCEIMEIFPDLKRGTSLPETLVNAASLSGRKFIMIIDEWDAPIREHPQLQKEYLTFLRSLFKNSGITAKAFAAAYMTGILPIKKDGSQSAISDFEEFTILDPKELPKFDMVLFGRQGIDGIVSDDFVFPAAQHRVGTCGIV